MNFKEAQKLMFDNWKIVSPHLSNSNTPAYMVLPSVIAPQGSNLSTLSAIYNKMADEEISNEQVLIDMDINENNLILYVSLKMHGLIYFLPFDSFLCVPWRDNYDGNLS